MIGLTLGVTSGTAFNTLLAALSFHQASWGAKVFWLVHLFSLVHCCGRHIVPTAFGTAPSAPHTVACKVAALT